MKSIGPAREINLRRLRFYINTQTGMLSLIGVLWGYLLITISKGVSSILYEIGLALFLAGVLLCLDQIMKRIVREETLQLVKVSNNIDDAGLKSITTLSNAILWTGWDDLFADKSIKKIRIAFNYSARWMGTNSYKIERFLERKGTSIDLLVPNPESKEAMYCIAQQKDCDCSEIKKLIEKTVKMLRGYGNETNVTVKMTNKPMSYQLYMFDDIPIVLMFPLKDKEDSKPFPLFEFNAVGEMSSFFNDDFNQIWDDKKNTQDYPKDKSI